MAAEVSTFTEAGLIDEIHSGHDIQLTIVPANHDTCEFPLQARVLEDKLGVVD